MSTAFQYYVRRLVQTTCTHSWTASTALTATAFEAPAQQVALHSRHIGTCATSPSKLHQIVDYEKLSREDPAAIADIWKSFHQSRRHQQVGSVLAAAEYDTLSERCKSSPMIVLPVPKDDDAHGDAGAFVSMLIQAQLPTILATTVPDYQKAGPEAPARFVITAYTELAATKDLVLLRGDIVDKSLLSWEDGEQLLANVCEMYLDDELFHHVHAFNHQPDQFDYNAVLQLFDCTTTPTNAAH